MFANIIDDISLFMYQESLTTVISEDFVNLLNCIDQSHRQYEEAIATLNETNNNITQKKEQLSFIEDERAKVMADLALQIQTKENLENTVKSLQISLQSIEFDFKNYYQMKSSTANLEIYELIKKTFLTYKNILRIFFDFGNNVNATEQGYLYNKITKKLIYFKFNVEERTADEITECLWNKIMLVSNNYKQILV
ncbi:Hypothetical protein CINCED_3A025665 [Cinara cedri]|uniref:Uncharacterized protein n=1 Tax=Cinara cedri TaxID=506608 RepID=A0A5E4N5M1_9HEMI|nr:Hypothetical protein CINCED_3A025665 [Cinara cedri]